MRNEKKQEFYKFTITIRFRKDNDSIDKVPDRKTIFF